MRVTDRMLVNLSLHNIRQGRERLGNAQTRVATGRRLLRPSDNPADVERAMVLTSELRGVVHQASSLDSTRNWLRGTEQALDSFVDALLNAGNLALRALNDTNSAEERTAMAGQVAGIVENALSVANTRLGEYYAFGGQQIRTAPFVRDTNGDIVYQGDDQEIRHPIEPGQTMPVNITGTQGGNGGIHAALNQLQQFQRALENNDQAGIQDFVDQVETVRSDLLSLQSLVGARTQRVNTTGERLQQREIDLRQMISELVDADMAEAITEMNFESQAYELNLSAAARVMPRSLLDFLR